MTTMQMTATHTMERAATETRDPGHLLPFLVGTGIALVSGLLAIAYVGLLH